MMTEITNNIIKNNLIWDDWFDQATEDISTFLWAAEEWEEPEEGYEADYLLLLLMTSRYRSRLAEDVLNNAPAEYSRYKEKLRRMRLKAEERLKTLFEKDIETISGIVSTEFTESIHEMTSLLSKVRSVALDGELYDDPDWVNDSLREYADEFIFDFRNMAIIADELRNDPFDRILSQQFQNEFRELDGLFKMYFNYFYPAKDLLACAQSHEYFADRWWLTQTPQPDAAEAEEDDAVFDAVMDTFKRIYHQSQSSAAEPCDMAETTIAYALDELTIEPNQKVFSHIISCPFCTDLVNDIRAALRDDAEMAVDDEIQVQEQAHLEEPDVYAIVNFLRLYSVIVYAAIKIRKRSSLGGYLGESKELSEGKEFDELPLYSYAQGYRQDNAVVLLDKNMTGKFGDLDRVISCMEENRFYYQVFGYDPKGRWVQLIEEPQKIKQPFIRMEDTGHNNYLIVLSQNKKDVRDGSEKLPDILAQKTIGENDFKPGLFMIEVVVR